MVQEKSQEWVNGGLRAFISSSVPSEQTRRVTWQSTEGRGGVGWSGGKERGGGGGLPWLESNQRGGRGRGGRVQADHVMVKSLQAAVLGKADWDIPPYWRCRFATTTVLGNGCHLYCSYYLHGADSACLSLSSSATVAGLTLVLPLIPSSLFLSSRSLSRLTRLYLAWMKEQAEGEKKPSKQQIMKVWRVT